MKNIVDQSIIETTDGCYFTVIGNVHPPGRYVGLLTYVPSEPWHSSGDISRKIITGREYTKLSRSWFGNRDDYRRHLCDFEHYVYRDAFFGPVTSVPEDRVKRVIKPSPVHGTAERACEMLGVPTESAALVGSSIIECMPDDIDVGIVGVEMVSRAAERLKALTASPDYQVYHDYFGCSHPRQFMCDGKVIDIFPLYAGHDEQPDIPYTTEVERQFLVEDTVTDASYGAFRPALYELAGGVPIASYQIEHRMILSEGDRIRLHAWRTPQGFLVRLGDPYEDMTERFRRIQ